MTSPINLKSKKESPIYYKDTLFLVGLGLLLLSASVLFFSGQIQDRNIFRPATSNYILGIYVIMVGYGIALAVNYKFRFGKIPQEYTFLWASIATVSCFALNFDVRVFEELEDWAGYYTLGAVISCIVYAFRSLLPKSLLYALYACMGAGSMMFVYFAFYLLPIYPLSLIAFWVMGLSLHTFVPLGLALQVFLVGYKAYQNNQKRLTYTMLGGFLVPFLSLIVFVSIFSVKYNYINKISNQQFVKNTLEPKDDKPAWVKIAQRLDNDWFTEQILKKEFFFVRQEWGRGFSLNFSDGFERRHNPILVILDLTTSKHALDEHESRKILESIHDKRHHTEQRLWTGENLQTSQIVTQVELYPEYRLAYTEKTFQIENNSEGNLRTSTQEALYTFYLPEGGVVTSLSLWINGKEEKGYLTSKSKADSAYKSIVGVEVRDPALVHWQEGNSITVRVFPCTPQEKRQFKIGITAPLKKTDKGLLYQSIYFKGTKLDDTKEFIRILNGKSFIQNASFLKFGVQNLEYEGDFKGSWELEVPEKPLTTTQFVFNGKSYELSPYEKRLTTHTIKNVYLDVNSLWTKEEYEAILKATKGKKVFTLNPEPVQITPQNAESVFESLHQDKFSMFAFQKLPETENTIVIGKSGAVSPNINDVKNEAFGKNLKAFLGELEQPIRYWNLNNDLTPYLKTLKELRVLIVEENSLEGFIKQLKNEEVVQYQENEQTVVLENAQIKITEKQADTTKKVTSNAPDHLLRLFAYNDLMRKIGKDFFSEQHIREDLLKQAQTAYIVSPLSSLIVLETQEDYKRFDIQKSKNSLENASLKNAGAVPEPHEWALIIVLVFSVWIFYKKGFRF
jgi:XrtN system VIT domain protein